MAAVVCDHTTGKAMIGNVGLLEALRTMAALLPVVSIVSLAIKCVDDGCSGSGSGCSHNTLY